MTQRAEILDYLKTGRSLTPLEALDLFGCLRLGARIWDLKREGHNIVAETLDLKGKHVARYTLRAKQEAMF